LAVDPIEIILLRQWASYIAVPMWITDAEGRLVFYNESAEPVLGVRFEEAGELPAEELTERFAMCDENGRPLSNHERPLMIALTKQMPAHRRIRLRGADGHWRLIEASAIPLTATGDRHLGAMAIFWENPTDPSVPHPT
jgi:PAS domain S-box-containing protein